MHSVNSVLRFICFGLVVFAQLLTSAQIVDVDVPAESTESPPAPADKRETDSDLVIDTGITIVPEQKVKQKKISSGFTLGHLMTPALSNLGAGEMTVGTMALGYGITRELTIAASPWLWGFYNMNNFVARYQAQPDRAESWGAELGYFKDNQSLGHTYQMEATSLWLLYRTRVSRFHRIHWSLNYMYFQDSTVPFSLKRWSFNESEPKEQISFTTLQEVATTPNTRLCVEAGIIGLNYHLMNYHFGASTAYRFEGGYIQFGLSATGYLGNITKSAYNQVYNKYMSDGTTIEFASVYKNSVAVHPEIQLQLLF